ncbi:MAG: hypothetical protein PHY56_06280 [Candidatus Omnitrophica bacterium]|jgi:hypothetical protein|nr:hypothetical protein [Candidatus Omnitrophota bacterium]
MVILQLHRTKESLLRTGSWKQATNKLDTMYKKHKINEGEYIFLNSVINQRLDAVR